MQKRKRGGNKAPVEKIEAETLLGLLRRAAESKWYEENKAGNVMSALPIFSLAACPVSKLVLSFAIATVSVRCSPVQSVPPAAGLGSRDLETVCL